VKRGFAVPPLRSHLRPAIAGGALVAFGEAAVRLSRGYEMDSLNQVQNLVFRGKRRQEFISIQIFGNPIEGPEITHEFDI
jgi:hypothetical protein